MNATQVFRTVTRLPLLTAILCACLAVNQGCSSTPKIYKPGRSGHHLKKRVCITRFEDHKRFGDAYLKRPFQESLTETLTKKCWKPVFIIPGQPDYPEAYEKLPMLDSGLVDNMALIETGRDNGFNAVITGTINDIRQRNETGWISGEHTYLQVTVTAEIYDTQTGAKLLDKTYLREVEIDVVEASETEKESGYFDIIAIENIFERIVADMSNDICKTVSNIHWIGFIVDSNGQNAVISSGLKTGLKTGDHLYVYRNDQVMAGAFGSQYRIPGPVIGELKVVAVTEESATAVLVSGTGATPGNAVSLK
ncbi:MAG: hypothetical protein LJE94_02060 [Deltaproteobacteria bacterium]|nr:hypothetical protein [Deltaproteobacteria bacterium]